MSSAGAVTEFSESVPSTAALNTAGKTPEDIRALNAAYQPLSFEQRIERLYHDFDPGRVLVTSSFAATSAYFLHIISRLRPAQTVFFIDTGFHFPETLKYKDYLVELFNLKVEDLRAEDYRHAYTATEKVYETDPDLCCTVNKIEPLDDIKGRYHVWVSSLMRWQSGYRAELDIFEVRRGIIKFNPMIDVTREERDAYVAEHGLPFHPLVAQGYASIGCTHCTVPGSDRNGRWPNRPKTECGLHF